jgi:uncharacterized repeat protein (TIGR01451 family)
MNRQKITSLLLVGAMATLTALAGCEQTRTTRPARRAPQAGSWSEDGPTTAGPTTPKPAPVRSTGNLNCVSLMYPTGHAPTSVLEVEKCTPKQVLVNQPFDTVISVTNLTALELTDVRVKEKLAANYEMRSATPQGRPAPGEVVWIIPTLGPKETKTIKMTGVATSEGPQSMTGTCAEVTYNSALCARIPVVRPELKLTKSAPDAVLKCDEIVYKMTVTNTGTGAINNVAVNDQLPAGLTSNGRQSLTFNVGTLAAGQSKELTARVNANRTGAFQNRATATGAGGITAESNSVSTTVSAPNLAITKSCEGTEFIGRASPTAA